MVWLFRSRIINSIIRSKAPLVGSYVHGDSCCSSVISSISRPFPKFMNWLKTDGCHTSAVASLPSFKKELEHFQSLAEAQYPKFMVIACADSRVCPSNILGFQPGEVFMIRNIANLVPMMKNGPSECNAALEFAVTTLEVENILVIGHSSCAGIETLMSMQEDTEPRNFIHNWVANGKVAKLRTKSATSHLSFDQQCRFCEKESINQSLLNLLSYPWIEDRVRKELLSIHGGYYNFSNCSFEKWTLDFKDCNVKEERSYVVKEKELWC
ncbi:beta carbonic anhydrase 5, chloroplastic isoform X2 [Cicer arietinum]|uniref:Carbonic anhydrase n=1 Tax=Cicer arietinum TaxID=3827 RepID=A0A3Q7X2R4_CICAR|nr:beta carbonic anhydrase 5, chloroplastic isoform X4 [Cicer arietinum]